MFKQGGSGQYLEGRLSAHISARRCRLLRDPRSQSEPRQDWATRSGDGPAILEEVSR
jgi:hypothetical protein